MADNDYITEKQGKALQAKIADALKARIKGTIAAADAGKALVIQSDGTVKAGAVGGTWDADKLAIARGFYEVLSSTEPTQTTYTASDGKTYPVVWVKPIEVLVPVVPEVPYWNDAETTVLVPDLVGVDYKITSTTKNGSTVTRDILITGGVEFDVAAATGLVAPFEVKVEAVAEPGYRLPYTYTWTHAVPDPNAVTVLTSDSFSAPDGPVMTSNTAGISTDAALGGTARPYNRGFGTLSHFTISGGRLSIVGASGGHGGIGFSDVGATNQRVEFDLSFGPDGKLLPFSIYLGTHPTLIYSGVEFWFTATNVSYNYSKGSGGMVGAKPLFAGAPPAGRYVLEFLNSTDIALTAPGAARYVVTAVPAIPTSTLGQGFTIRSNEAATNTAITYLDNLVISKIGF